MSKPDLSVPTRQELRGFLVIFIMEAQKTIRNFWPMLVVIVAQKKLLPEGVTIPMALLVLVLLLFIHATLSFLNFYFYVEDNQFMLKKGYLRKKVLSVPLERIQSINTKQNLLQQLFNVHSLEIDTAGSVGKELKIYSLSAAYASALTQLLQVHKEKQSDDPEEIQTATHQGDEIIKLSPADLFRIGISQNHLRSGLLMLALGSQIFSQLQDIFQSETEAYSNSFRELLSHSGIAFFSMLIVLFLIVSILVTLFATVIKYYNFTLTRTPDSYGITAGLFNKRNVVLPFTKVQQLNWETGPIKKVFGIYKITFKQAVSKQSNKVQVADAPGCLENHVSQIRNELFQDDLAESSPKIYSHPRYFRVLWMLRGWGPVLLFTPAYILDPLWLIAGGIWLILSAFYCRMMVRKRYFQFNQTQLIVGKGGINTVWQQAAGFKSQSVDVKQSFFQKRKGLATLRVNNASGKMTIPYIPESMAYALMNYLVYRVELSNEKWM